MIDNTIEPLLADTEAAEHRAAQSKRLTSASSGLPDDIAEFVGPPPILHGDDPQQYDSVFSRVAAVVAPRDAIEWLWVKDFTDALWEGRRVRKMRDQIGETKPIAASRYQMRAWLMAGGRIPFRS